MSLACSSSKKASALSYQQRLLKSDKRLEKERWSALELWVNESPKTRACLRSRKPPWGRLVWEQG